MKLRELLNIISSVAKTNKIAEPLICGGVVREKVMGTLKKMDDIDLTNGDQSIKNLAKEVEIELGNSFKIHSKLMEDGHTSLYTDGDNGLKIDFSSNFIADGIDQALQKMGVKKITPMIKEAYSRDFTCNSLLMKFDLKTISDPTGKGIADIRNKIIRTCLPPEITLGQNTNRLIRVIYLAAKLNFDIDPAIIKYISDNKQLFSKIDPGYLTRTLNKAIEHNIKKTAEVLDTLGLWKDLPITEALYPLYAERFIKTAQLRKNFDYGEGFYAHIQDVKSVSDFRKKRKKKQKKQIKKIKDMKLAYYSGIDDYMNDNFPVLLNDDLEGRMDREENDVSLEEDKVVEKAKGEDRDTGETKLEPTENESPYSSIPGAEGLFSMPLSEYAGSPGPEEPRAVVNNPYNAITNNMGLLMDRALNDLADQFVKLAYQ